ncbi:DUF3732 domain-containing protein [Cellulosilyticum sp. ST5]|uniref:DUF3732 domain-containing protein n=1 Tax=Cellulosilyticum sp. ST5 TaxID=3055805 RepID=UPI003977CCB2
MKNGNVRELKFEPNKVNVITGGCETGKSTILAIIDYCFFASGNSDSGDIKIPQTIINENIEWYGVRFGINDKLYTLARKALEGENKPKNEYYFSTVGEVPETITSNNGEKEIKEVLNEEFKIDEKIVIPYNGNKIKMGNKISLRYFMLFNSQDENTITNTDVFFDKQTLVKYQEALNRVFDIAIGISNPEDILITEKIKELEQELIRYEKKQEVSIKSKDLFEQERIEIIEQARAYGIIEKNSKTYLESLEQIKEYISTKKYNENTDDAYLEEIDKKERQLKQQIVNIRRFFKAYKEYREILSLNEDSLKPLKTIKKYIPDDIENPAISKILKTLEDELCEIKKALTNKPSSNYTLNKKLIALEKELHTLKGIKAVYEERQLVTQAEKYMFLGEIKNKLHLYDTPVEQDDYTDKIEECKENLKQLHKMAEDKGEHKKAIIRLLEDFINELLIECKDAMDTYKGFLPVFNYNKKKLELQKPNTTEIIKVAGSSSNSLFLHLCLMLGLHQVMINQKVPYVASYLILDQPSRPYYDNAVEKLNDRQRIKIVMQLLNDYIDRINERYREEFQIIVVEHIMPEIWAGMKNVHLVEEFVDGNKLIRKKDILKSEG